MFYVSETYVNASSGARGLGYNMAEGLAHAGMNGIALFDYQKELGSASARRLEAETGAKVHFFAVDVRDAPSVASAVDSVYQKFGRLDVAINAAGIAE